MWQSCWPRCMSSRLKQSALLASNPFSSVYTNLCIDSHCTQTYPPVLHHLPETQSIGSQHSCTILPSLTEFLLPMYLAKQDTGSADWYCCITLTSGAWPSDAALCLCSVLESQLPELATCAEEVTLKHLLWTSLHSWGEVTQDLSRTEFSQVDAEKLEAVVGQYARTALKIEKGLSPNQVRKQTLSVFGTPQHS